MVYKIGDIAELFNLSNEMIRYYEKYDIIHPKRDKKNGYRYYTIFDVYSLFECIQYQQLGIKIRDISGFVSENHYYQLKKELDHNQKLLQSEIHYKELLKQRFQELSEQVDVLRLNISNYWIKMINKKYAFSFTTGKGDQYDSFLATQDNTKLLLTEKYVSFLECYVEFLDNKEEWYFQIDEKYYSHLNIPVITNIRVIPARYCLCTIIDMGEIGSFNKGCHRNAVQYALEKGYEIQYPISGSIIGRGFEDDKYTRYLELQIPIIIDN